MEMYKFGTNFDKDSFQDLFFFFKTFLLKKIHEVTEFQMVNRFCTYLEIVRFT